MQEIELHLPHDGRRAFNASICDWGGRLLIAYRVSYHDKPDSLRIAELDRKTFAIVSDRPLETPLSDGWGAEDPRLFEHNGVLHVAWTGADYSKRPWRATMFYGPITWRHYNNTVAVRRAYQPKFGFNEVNQREKNWQFFSRGGQLYAQYVPSPHRIIQLDGDRVTGEWTSAGFEWAHGRPSGGTPPILTERGTYLTFFHSFIHHQNRERLYSFAAMEFSAAAPFEVLGVSPEPILTAHDGWDTPGGEWQPLCVFPGGSIPHDGGYLVAAGVNDIGVRLFHLTPADMPLALPASIQPKPLRYFRALESFMFEDRVRIKNEIIETDEESARKLIERNWLTTV